MIYIDLTSRRPLPGPEPGSFAVWTLSAYAELAAIARSLDDPVRRVRLAAAGAYTEIAREIP